jgi:hypothetical protein
MILKSHSDSHVSCWRKGLSRDQMQVWNNGAFFPYTRCYATDSSYVVFRLFKDNKTYSLSWSGLI